MCFPPSPPLSGDPATAVNSILSSSPKQTTHIAALLTLANRPGNNGVEPRLHGGGACRAVRRFVDFVTALAAELHKAHHQLVLEVPAPMCWWEAVWNTGAYDWSSPLEVGGLPQTHAGPR